MTQTEASVAPLTKHHKLQPGRTVRRSPQRTLQAIRALATQEPLLVFAAVAGVAALALIPWITHPGLQVAGATILLDMVLWKERRHLLKSSAMPAMPTMPMGRLTTLILVLMLNILGLIAVLHANDDPFAITLTSFDGILTLITLLLTPFTKRRRQG